jgi:hypothetical protein
MVKIQIQHEVKKISVDNIPNIDQHVTVEMLNMFVSHLHRNSFFEIKKQESSDKKSVIYSLIGYGMDKREYMKLRDIHDKLINMNKEELNLIADDLKSVLTTMTPSIH